MRVFQQSNFSGNTGRVGCTQSPQSRLVNMPADPRTGRLTRRQPLPAQPFPNGFPFLSIGDLDAGQQLVLIRLQEFPKGTASQPNCWQLWAPPTRSAVRDRLLTHSVPGSTKMLDPAEFLLLWDRWLVFILENSAERVGSLHFQRYLEIKSALLHSRKYFIEEKLKQDFIFKFYYGNSQIFTKVGEQYNKPPYIHHLVLYILLSFFIYLRLFSFLVGQLSDIISPYSLRGH